MRMSRGITLTVLGAATLTACLCGMPGCGRRGQADHTWYDAQGNVIPERWKTDETGKKVPDPHPYDRYHRPWVYDAHGNLVPPLPPAGTSYRRGPALWLWGGPGYRTFGGSSSSPRPSTSGSSSVTRGGFGSTGAAIAGGG
jgi:hypothetical protein